jgi:dienelactone hydrolase
VSLLFGLATLGYTGCGAGAGSDSDQGADEALEDKMETVEVDIVGKTVNYRSGETDLVGYLAYDKNQTGPRPGVLVVHEWWGNNDYAHRRADMLAEMGYVALAVDMYGDGKTAEHPDDAGAFASQTMSDLAEATARFKAGMDVLKGDEHYDGAHMAAIGYCFGGGVVYNMARAGLDLDAAATFHGSLVQALPKASEGENQPALLICHGMEDPMVTMEMVEAAVAEWDADDVKFIGYEGATHGFTNPEADSAAVRFGLPVGYNAEADSASWAEMTVLLDRVFSGQPPFAKGME